MPDHYAASEPPVRSSERVRCDWMEDELDGYWRTSCGDLHQFTDGGPENNNHKFCPYCGKTLHAIHCQAPNSKVSYHADNAGGAHGKDTNDK